MSMLTVEFFHWLIQILADPVVCSSAVPGLVLISTAPCMTPDLSPVLPVALLNVVTQLPFLVH